MANGGGAYIGWDGIGAAIERTTIELRRKATSYDPSAVSARRNNVVVRTASLPPAIAMSDACACHNSNPDILVVQSAED